MEIGSRVKITNAGAMYTTYKRWADYYQLDKYVEGLGSDGFREGRVVAYGTHTLPDSDSTFIERAMLVGIRLDNGRDVIIGEEGVKVTAPPKTDHFKEDLFVL